MASGARKVATGPAVPVTIRDMSLVRRLCAPGVRPDKAKGTMQVRVPGAGPPGEDGKAKDLDVPWLIDPGAWNPGHDEPERA